MLRQLGTQLGTQLGLFDEPAPARTAAPTPRPTPTPTPKPKAGPEVLAPSHQVQLGAQHLPFELTRAKRHSIGFSMGPEGLKVRAPRWVSLADIERALQARGDWILRQQGRLRERQRHQEAMRIEWGEGARLPYLGAPLLIARGSKGLQAPSSEAEAAGLPLTLTLPLPSEATAAQWRDATQAWLQAQARTHFQQRLVFFAGQLGIACPKLRLSSARGRWGSASSGGVVSLNWRLMHFSPALIDYVVAHEVAHLREMNHGPGFWTLVGELLPGFEASREALRQVELPPGF